MLRKNDISEDLLQVLRKQQSSTKNKNSDKPVTSDQMLENDTKVTVYVKEVFKNSG